MIRDVSTRWNSTAELVQRALELKNALKILVVKADHNKPRGIRLARFTLSEDEWVLLKQLSPLLEVCLFTFIIFPTSILIPTTRYSSMRQNKYPQAQLRCSIKLSQSWIRSHQHSTNSLTTPSFILPFAMQLSGGS
jgi:hypothetical protein